MTESLLRHKGTSILDLKKSDYMCASETRCFDSAVNRRSRILINDPYITLMSEEKKRYRLGNADSIGLLRIRGRVAFLHQTAHLAAIISQNRVYDTDYVRHHNS